MKRASVWMMVCVCGAAAAIGAGCKGEKRNDKPPPPPPAATADTGATKSAARAHADAAPKGAPESKPADAAKSPAAPGVDVSKFSGPDAYDAKAETRVDLPSGLVIEDLRTGEGPSALPGAIVTFHYRGKVKDGKEFDCTLDREGGSKPEEHPINKLFMGLANGMIGMKAGGRRRLTIPPYMAPGIVGMKDSEGKVLIPPDATLIYVIDMVEVKPQALAPAIPPPPPASSPAAKPAAPSKGGGAP